MLLLAAIVSIFVYGMIAALLGTILPALSDRFKLTPRQNGTIAMAQALGLILASIGIGPLLDNEGTKISLVLGLSLIAIALFLLPRSTGFSAVVVLLLILGLGGGIVVTGANALVSSVSEAHRGTALNLVNLFFGLGGMATPFLLANLFSRNWVRLCWSVATLTLVALVIQGTTKLPPPVAAKRFILSESGALFEQPLLYILGCFLFLYIACEVGVWNWLVRHLIAQGIPEPRAFNILSLGFALGLLTGRVGVSPILIRVSAERVTLASSAAMVITTFLILHVRKVTSAYLLAFFAGVSMAPLFPTTLAIVGDAFPRMTGTAIGFVMTCGWIGLAVSSRLIGAIAGDDPLRLKKALLLIPISALIMIGLNLSIMSLLHS